MRAYTNPFRLRASEQQRDNRAFVRNFGAGVLDLLPNEIWDRLFVIRSAPGGGKTSLMRVFTLDSLMTIDARRDDFEPLVTRLTDLGVLDSRGIRTFGVMLRLDRDYRALVDVGAPPEAAVRLFFRLLDARIMAGTIRTALQLRRLRYPADAGRVRFVPEPEGADEASRVGEILGGLTGSGIQSTSHDAEAEIIHLLDALRPVDWESGGSGHNDLHALRLLSLAEIYVDDLPLGMRPLVLLDDGHELAPEQREALLDRLSKRDLRVARWYSERLQALAPSQLMVGSAKGRDYAVLDLEQAARTAARQVHGRRFRFEKLLLEIGNLRAARALERAEEGDNKFSDLLEVDHASRIGDRASEIFSTLNSEIDDIAGGDARYSAWRSEARAAQGFAGAVRIQELAILIARDRRRPMQELFPFALGEDEAARLSSSTLRDAAELFVCNRFRVPYYLGPEILARLGSQNIEQFLSLAGDLFEQILGLITLGKKPDLSATQQDRILRSASDAFWKQIPERVPNGRDVQTLALAIARLGAEETYRPTAPYAPGVTGTAITMSDRDRLLDDRLRKAIPGGERLYDALASAIAFNVISADLDVSVKADQYMVLYLNRLLLPRFMLPLGRGGFREKPVELLAQWLRDARTELDLAQSPLEMGR